MSKRYECKLSEEAVTKANEELNEPLDNNQRLRLIDELLEAYKGKFPEQKLTDDEQKDEFLLRFLRARKFDIDRAVQMMNNYITRREIFPEIFDKVDHPQLLSDFLDTKYITVLEGSAKNGSALILVRPCFGCDDPPLLTVFAGAFLTIERLLEKEENQIHGVTLIEDVNFVNMNLVKQLGPVIGRKFASIMQDTLPMRLKNICFLNESTILDVFFTIIKPFLNNKTKERIMLVGKKMEVLHEKVDAKYLPEEYGGKLREDELNHAKWKSVLIGKSTAM